MAQKVESIIATNCCFSSTCNDNNKAEQQTSAAATQQVNPLDDLVVRQTLTRIQVSGGELIKMSVKELNKRLVDCPPFVVNKLKRCRRTLKNRGYAKNCRIKRIAAKNSLEQTNEKLRRENVKLKESNKSLVEQLNQLSFTLNELRRSTTLKECCSCRVKPNFLNGNCMSTTTIPTLAPPKEEVLQVNSCDIMMMLNEFDCATPAEQTTLATSELFDTCNDETSRLICMNEDILVSTPFDGQQNNEFQVQKSLY